MKCVVTGGSGFLGGAIVDELLGRSDDVVIVDREGRATRADGVRYVKANILDYAAIQRVVYGADEVYHLAGMLGTSELSGHICEAVMVNIIGAINVMEACVKAEVPRLFYPAKPNVWLNIYSITKKAVEDLATLFNEEYNTKIVRLRWFNAYGPEQQIHLLRKIIPTMG